MPGQEDKKHLQVVSSSALETRVAMLEDELQRLVRRMDDTAQQTGTHASLLATLTEKIDALRGDLREIKQMPNNFVPRIEIDARMRFSEERIEELQESLKSITTQMNSNHVEVNRDMHKNTLATYGTFIAAVFSAIGIVISLLASWPHK